jgi:lipoprotein-releasing system permease protein
VYKVLLCWRYLLTRYLAMACVVSVMLGVATLIVVNSVMAGFSDKLKDRLHGLLSDVLIEAQSYDGFPNYKEMMARIEQDPELSQKIEAMTPTLEIFAMLQFERASGQITRAVRLIGIDPVGRTKVGGFSEYLKLQKGRPDPSFALSPQARQRFFEMQARRPYVVDGILEAPHREPGDPPPPDPPPGGGMQLKIPESIIVGYALAAIRTRNPETGKPEDRVILEPGDAVVLTTVSGGARLAPVYDRFTVCDYFKSEMSEYDANYVFVPLEYLQRLRTMENRVTSIQIKLHDYQDAKEVVKKLGTMFASWDVHAETWEEKQGPILGAISIERGLLNVLLFLIIGVAGFGILAIFAMIVAEKTRDIGILKALGASDGGVMKIFLGYGLLLGVVGTTLGTVLGLQITTHVNDIEHVLTKLTGHEIFDRSIYYFDRIPTTIQFWAVTLVNIGAVTIAVLASVLPALRAALLHPVRALRYE